MNILDNKISYWDLQQNYWENHPNEYKQSLEKIEIDNKELFELYEYLIYQNLRTHKDKGLFFEDSFGISGWLFANDYFGQNALSIFKEKLNSVNDLEKMILERMENEIFQTFQETRKQQARETTTLNLTAFNFLWEKIPNPLVISFTGKELGAFIQYLDSMCNVGENIFKEFQNSLLEIHSNEIFDVTTDVKIFETIPSEMLNRLSSDDISALIEFIRLKMFQRFLEVSKTSKLNNL